MLKGPDLSHFQTTEWDELAPRIDFALIKLSGGYTGGDGKMFIDPKGANNVEQALKHKVLAGGYHYARFNTVQEAHDEADHYRSQAKGKHLDFALLDIEDPSQHGNLTEAANAFLDDIKDLAPKTALYTSPAFADEHFDEGITRQNLWIANWLVDKPDIDPWKRWNIWQYTSTGHLKGVGGRVDLNYMHDGFAEGLVATLSPKNPKPHKDHNAELLENGDHGPAVVRLQKELIILNYSLAPYGVDGDFGDVTETAVKRFQRGAGITADGIVGPVTRSKLRAALRYPGHLFMNKQPMMHNFQVEMIQRSLNLFGIKLKIDGWYGNDTAHAVRRFQRNHKLKVDGIVGPKTWAKLI